MKTIFVITPGSMSQEDIDKIQAEGYLIVEHKNPEEIRTLQNFEEFEGKQLLSFALSAIDHDSNGEARGRFSKLIREELRKKYPL